MAKQTDSSLEPIYRLWGWVLLPESLPVFS